MIIALSINDAEEAERLLDFCFRLSGRIQSGSCLLIAPASLHEEFRIKVRLAAEVAFSHVDMTTAADNHFAAAASKVRDAYKEPWLFIESDCVPLRPDWIDQLSNAYDAQPKKFMGAHVKDADGKLFLARQSVYAADFNPALERLGASTKCRMVQHGAYTKREDIRPDAVLFCSDKAGELIKSLRSELK
jgi:hypothetical protein